MKHLGHVQVQALRLMQDAPRTAADLAGLASRSVVGDALCRLADRGLARPAGNAPNAHPLGQGRPRKVYAITGQGQQELATALLGGAS